MTPITVMTDLKPAMAICKTYLKVVFVEDGKIFNMAVSKFAPVVLSLYSNFLIPMLVSQVGERTAYNLKSNKHKSNMWRYLFYFFVNTILLPLINLVTLQQAKDFLLYQNLINKIESARKGVLNTSTFFISYLIASTFISSCFLIFDIGH